MATTVTKTVKPGGGGDYTSLAAFNAGEARDLVTADEIAQAECYAGNCSPCTMSGWTTDATRYIDVVAAAGAEAGMPWRTSGAAIISGSSYPILSMGSFDGHVAGLQIEHTGGGANEDILARQQFNATLMERCFLRFALSYGNTRRFFRDGTYRNCVFTGDGNGTCCVIASGSIDSSTFHVTGGGTSSIVRPYVGGVTIRNTVVVTDAARVCFESMTGNYNASTDATAPGANSLHSISDPFEDTAGGDYTPAAGSALLDVGDDLSADFGDDFLGTSRPQGSAWDIGAIELVVSGGNTSPAKPTVSVDSLTSSLSDFSTTAFSDPDSGDTHFACQWQFTTASDPTFASPISDTGEDTTDLTTLQVDLSGAQGQDLLVRARHEDDSGDAATEWSPWSDGVAFTVPTAGAAVSATTATLTLATYAADVVLDTDVLAGTATLTLTAHPATVSADTDVLASTAALTLQAHPATVSADTDVLASTAALTLQTHPATVALDIDVLAATATLTLQAHPATVEVGSSVTVQATTATLTLATHSAVVSAPTHVLASTAALTLQTHPATTALDIDVQASTLALSLQTHPATVHLDVDVAAATAALTLAPHGAVVSYDVDVRAAVASLLLTTYRATIPGAQVPLAPPFTATWIDPARTATWIDPARTATWE